MALNLWIAGSVILIAAVAIYMRGRWQSDVDLAMRLQISKSGETIRQDLAAK
ncbi:hypothetical protein QTH87_23325 [Variovorax sp. J22P168]|uniref:hypothetical protein n=1 Tax=Variovorax jilinensis TaxID=3053513 RepID=UPI00257745E3|nr:hypothetical protein [Variovorax sp. J22P168]MDM0015394.1 hypothetical protein [Variovorax sp. J22P168]